MASVEWWKVLCCVLFVIIRDINTEHYQEENLNVLAAAPEFARYSVFKPKIYHGREKREISSTRQDREGLQHIHDITLVVSINGKDQVLDLRLNRELLHKNYFIRHQQNGSHVVHNPEKQDVELCHYQGKLRGIENSWAAISTCRGLRGMIYDGESLHYVERASGGGSGGDDDNHIIETDHFLYSHEDLNTNHSCGYSGTHIKVNKDISRIHRYKRSAEVIRGPYNANRQSRFVELVLVVDNKEYKALGEDINRVNSHCKDIANLINGLYVPLNIFIALIGVVVWTEFDEISLSTNGDTTLTNFLHYRRQTLVKEHPNDNAQLLTRIKFDGGVVGKALKGPICTFEFSGGVSMDHSNVVGLVATTVAHEMGHNFGMEHDDNDCQCPEERCIMAPSSSSLSPVHWSSCSLEYLALAFEHGMDYCLRNRPERLFDSPVCGNGYVENGEQCDCGLKEYCDNPCCNATTCMLYSNASCATGECCDLQTCRPKTAGSVCRSADHECDLPEFCTGQSEFCPEDVFKMDGEKCDRGKAFCYQGSCRTHSDQCKLLWGPSGKSSDTQCYKMNKKGSRHGNCGYNRLNQSYIKCDDGDIYCGMLHCMHLNERLEFGMESVAILSHSYINSGGSIIPCRTAIVDLGLNQVDPGLAPDGAKCGEGKMCVNQRCMPVESLQASASLGGCPQQCNNNGVCNSRGHCHCRTGFAPPFCDYPGTGGSEDSGPASDPNARKEVIAALYIVFLGIVPFVAFVSLFVYYMRRNPVFWRKKPRVPTYVSRVVSRVSFWQKSDVMQHGNCMDAAGSKHNIFNVNDNKKDIYIIPCSVGGGSNTIDSTQPIYANVSTHCTNNADEDDDNSSQSSWDDCTEYSLNTCYNEVGPGNTHNPYNTVPQVDFKINSKPSTVITPVRTKTARYDRAHLPCAPEKPPNAINKVVSASEKHGIKSRSIATQCDEPALSVNLQCNSVSANMLSTPLLSGKSQENKRINSSARKKDCQITVKADDVDLKVKSKVEITKSDLLFTTNTQVNQLLIDVERTHNK